MWSVETEGSGQWKGSMMLTAGLEMVVEGHWPFRSSACVCLTLRHDGYARGSACEEAIHE